MTADTQLTPWVKRANSATCLVLVVATAYVLVKLVYLFVDTSVGSAPFLYGQQSAGSQTVGRQDKIDTSVIAMWSLFGKEGRKEVKTEQPKDVNAPKTRLSLELQAVFVAPVEERSTAMIAERRDSKLYHIGDKVPGNVTLAAVYQDRVLLNRNGQLEALYFPENDKGAMTRSSSDSSTNRSRTSRNSRATSNSRTPNGRPGFGASGSGIASQQAQTAMAQQMVSTLREQVEQDPGEVLGQFGLASNNGRGYRVSDSPNPMLAAIGAKPGDVILSVNGRNLGDPTQDVALIEQVMEDGTVRVSMERDGRQFDSEVALPGL